jgi:hypothetical protein
VSIECCRINVEALISVFFFLKKRASFANLIRKGWFDNSKLLEQFNEWITLSILHIMTHVLLGKLMY